MSEWRRRGVLWTGLLALALSLLIPDGHEPPPAGVVSVAILQDKPGMITVRLAGDIPSPGLYQVGTPGTVGEVISRAAPDLIPTLTETRVLSHPLFNGDLVTITKGAEPVVSVVPGGISPRERIILGIPLEPARMNGADWESLPGIGPALTKRIMTFARQRGGIRTLDDLREVDGIGNQTVEKLRPLFDGGISKRDQ